MRAILMIFSILFTACVVKPPDVPVCKDISTYPASGYCVYTISNKEQYVDDEHPLDGQTWFDLQVKSVRLPTKSWGEIKKFIIKICKGNKMCAEFSNWERTVDLIDGVAAPVGVSNEP